VRAERDERQAGGAAAVARSRERRLATARDRVAAAAGDFPDTNPKRERGSLSTADRVVAPNPKREQEFRPIGRASESSSRWRAKAAPRNPRGRFGLVW
jgi:hypothetical protein